MYLSILQNCFVHLYTTIFLLTSLIAVKIGNIDLEDASTELMKPIEISVNVLPTYVNLPCEDITLSTTLGSRAPKEYAYTYDWDIKDNETGTGSMKYSVKTKKSLEISELKEGSYPLVVTVKCNHPEPNGSEGKYKGNFLVYPGTI